MGRAGEKEKGLQIGLKMFRVNCERELKEVGLNQTLVVAGCLEMDLSTCARCDTVIPIA